MEQINHFTNSPFLVEPGVFLSDPDNKHLLIKVLETDPVKDVDNCEYYNYTTGEQYAQIGTLSQVQEALDNALFYFIPDGDVRTTQAYKIARKHPDIYAQAKALQNDLQRAGIASHDNVFNECCSDFGCCNNSIGNYYYRVPQSVIIKQKEKIKGFN